MTHSIRRFCDDFSSTWRAMPKLQALRWYAAVLQHAPTVLRERKFYSADREMHGKLVFFLLGHAFTVDADSIIQRLQQEGFKVKWLDDAGYPSDGPHAGYIYASKIGSLKN